MHPHVLAFEVLLRDAVIGSARSAICDRNALWRTSSCVESHAHRKSRNRGSSTNAPSSAGGAAVDAATSKSADWRSQTSVPSVSTGMIVSADFVSSQ